MKFKPKGIKRSLIAPRTIRFGDKFGFTKIQIYENKDDNDLPDSIALQFTEKGQKSDSANRV